MKNTFLKKAGAVALAAVMAVTFAPVASLNVFANSGVNKDNEVDDDTATITDASISLYKVTTTSSITVGNGNGSVTGNSKKVINIDANGNDITVIVNDKDATVNISNSGNISEFKTGITKVNVEVKSAKAIKLKGNFERGTVTPGNLTVAGMYDAPTAELDGNTIEIGNDAINAKNRGTTGGCDIVAVYGGVVIDKLAKGKTAKVKNDAAVGTTVKVNAAENGVTLQTLKTTYSFAYKGWKLNDAGRGEGSVRSGRTTYVDTRYYAGSDKNAASDIAFAADLTEGGVTTTDGIFVAGGIAFETIKDATNSSKMTIYTSADGEDKRLYAETAVNFAIAKDITDSSSFKMFVTPNGTYYDFDPTDYVKTDYAFACIDGSKYRVTNENNDLLKDVSPAKSFKLIQTKEYTKKDGNKNAVVVLDKITPDITIDAADDLTAVLESATHVKGTTTWKTGRALFFGTEKFGDDDVKRAFDAKKLRDADTITEVKLNVAKLAKGADKTFTLEGVATASSVEHASGIGYYRTAGYNYTFGDTKTVTTEFEDNAQGVTKNGINANPTFRDGTIYASKEIKTTVKGVNADVTFLGEISASATETDKAGKKTWEINLADTATNDKAVVAYRLYDGNRGEHIYTYNPVERDMLVKSGWKEETSDIKVLPVDAKTGVTVYRVYNPNNGGAHVYTTNPEEVKMLLAAGWEEGVAVFKTPAAGTANTLPVYRVYNTGSKNGEHQFTTSAAEKDNLVNHGWKLEGTPWYSFK